LSEAKDLYAILGVLPDAEPEVIRAVYLALAKKYHPDSSGSTENEEKFKEINAAYEILSDPEQRQEYDATRSDEEDATGQYEPDVDDEDLSVDDYQDDWEFAVEYRPELEDLLKQVATISPTLSIVFQSTILSNRAFIEADKIANDLITVFMKRYFGSSVKVRNFARNLLRNKKMAAAKELNRAVKIFGDGINSDDLIRKIKTKYKLEPERAAPRYNYKIIKDGNVYIVIDMFGIKLAGTSNYGTEEAARIYMERYYQPTV
jgi:curved DNA-binding protein CbpA